MKMRNVVLKWVFLLGCCALSGGCVAVDVGKPEVFTKEYPADILPTGPAVAVSRQVREVVRGRDADGRRILWIGLEGEVVSKQPREQLWERVSVEKQRRMGIGVMPSKAELLFRPRQSLQPMVGWTHKGEGNYTIWTSDNDLAAEFLLGFLFLPYSLLRAPFLPYECGTHHWGRQSNPSFFPKGNPGKNEESKVNYLSKFSDQERQAIGAWIWSDEKKHPQRSATSECSHLGVLGVHKYCTYVVKGPEKIGKRTPKEAAIERTKRGVPGPYRVTLELPECGFSRTREVPRGETGAEFDLGGIAWGESQASGTVRFLPPGGGMEEIPSPEDRALLETAVRQSFPVEVQVRPNGWTRAAEVPPPVVKEIHHYHETRVEVERKTEEAPWEIETEEAYHGGRATYLVTIRDASKKAFEVEREVKPEIERLLREAFAASMPGMDESRVRAYALPDFAGRAIRFRGVAFSVQPANDGWRYDPDTRRGTVRLRLSEGMTAEEAKRWARENIEAIVKEKNVALEAGAALPEGAVYRSLGEALEGGVLTVEFEAVE